MVYTTEDSSLGVHRRGEPYGKPNGCAHRSSRQMINVGFLGYGYWGPNLLRTLSRNPKARVVSAHDPCPDNAARLARDYPTVRLAESYHDMFEDPEIDAVVIATPADTHFPLAWQALLWGKHVF